jgi:hypothetical protein
MTNRGEQFRRSQMNDKMQVSKELFANIENAVAALLKEPKVLKEIEEEGSWFRRYELKHMQGFIFELSESSVLLGFFDIVNGDVVKDGFWKFAVREGSLEPREYLSDTNSRKARRFVLDEEHASLTEFGGFSSWDGGLTAAIEYGIPELLEGFNQVFHHKYEPLLRKGAKA